MTFSLLPLVDTVTKLFPSATMTALNGVFAALTGDQTIAGIKTFSSAPVVPDDSFAIAKVDGLQDALDDKTSLSGDQTFTGTKTFSSAPVVPDDAFDIAAIDGLQDALDAKVATSNEITSDDVVDPLDTTAALITGRRMRIGVDASTGGVQHIYWDSATSTWPTARTDAVQRIFHSRPYPDADPPLGQSDWDEWEFAE